MNRIVSDVFAERQRALKGVLATYGRAAVALSGGVDSLTLATFAHRTLGREAVKMVHAVSPAVPKAATERVRDLARQEGWRLEVVDAGEFADERYRSNPVNRCYFCKTNLYRTLHRIADGVVLSGTNSDDLTDFRPGLTAASENRVRHPYVDVGFAKNDVRRLARSLGLGDVAVLPATPCLASRVETGLRVEPEHLLLIDRVESWFREERELADIRFRHRHDGWVVELDSTALEQLDTCGRNDLVATLRAAFPEISETPVSVAPYRRGSAFVRPAP
ncbi:uncharacterized protein CLV78_111127 [Aliiruegeria haliotis]|uniref:Adenine nucleotide alpha hydrolase n=1 Tax=Aliiruegeria haliotis TaxID=1280846 RepID=A0A2T0RIM5_9RHOB|nr:adenine nucleotide alpha hydrolase [Aliiruegeria haliotis]PRY20972.1 uncharacterized protein CLV78_111127 [Aliiruegeria haliotis]